MYIAAYYTRTKPCVMILLHALRFIVPALSCVTATYLLVLLIVFVVVAICIVIALNEDYNYCICQAHNL